MLSVQLDRSNRVYAPGEVMVVRVQWSFDRAPEELDLVLEWSTEGKGTGDGDAAAEEFWDDLSPQGERTWEVVVPRGPLSLHGSLIRIQWHVVCETDLADEVRVPFVVSHIGSPIRLNRVDSAKA